MRGASGFGIEFLEYEVPRRGRAIPIDTRANDAWRAVITLAVPDLARTVSQLTATPAELPIGDMTVLTFTLATTSPTQVDVDYVVHPAGAAGADRPKVFKLTTRRLEPCSPATIIRRHIFQENSVRRLHPGPHRIDIQVNGRVLASTSITLTSADALVPAASR